MVSIKKNIQEFYELTLERDDILEILSKQFELPAHKLINITMSKSHESIKLNWVIIRDED
jgi:hypothetical protein